ncbi:hypothetical protein NQZ68_036694 [Dissostichus eleginoides]|nr:hypothetical protein NQZ68_036694 [Dissostichus eleginoides]
MLEIQAGGRGQEAVTFDPAQRPDAGVTWQRPAGGSMADTAAEGSINAVCHSEPTAGLHVEDVGELGWAEWGERKVGGKVRKKRCDIRKWEEKKEIEELMGEELDVSDAEMERSSPYVCPSSSSLLVRRLVTIPEIWVSAGQLFTGTLRKGPTSDGEAPVELTAAHCHTLPAPHGCSVVPSPRA